MRLSKIAILSVNGTPKAFKEELARELNTSPQSVYRWISANEVNGPLTKTRAVQMISAETGLDVDKILEEPEEEVAR